MRAVPPRRSLDDGFALIEIAVVAAIVFILAGIVLFSLAKTPSSGQQSACNSEKSALATAEEASYARAGAYLPQSTTATAGDLTGKGAGLLAAAPRWYTVSASGKGTGATYSVDVNSAGRAAGCS